MKFLITESQKNSVRTKITKSISEKGIWDTMSEYKLSLKSLDFIYKGSEIPNLTCPDLSVLINRLTSNGIINTDNIIIGDYLLNLSIHTAISFKVKSLEHEDSITGFATPYWGGNCEIPIEFQEYYPDAFSEFGGGETEYIVNDFYKIIDLSDLKFSTFSEIKTWFENDYVQILIDSSKSLIEKMRR
jgi:hypothetical protein